MLEEGAAYAACVISFSVWSLHSCSSIVRRNTHSWQTLFDRLSDSVPFPTPLLSVYSTFFNYLIAGAVKVCACVCAREACDTTEWLLCQGGFTPKGLFP